MAAFRARAADLPEEFPVFPLPGALLLPRGRLPLNIFEPRYLALITDALAAGRMFGMIQPDATRPDGPSGPALFRVGCLGRLIAFNETEDGRFLVTLLGLARFAVAAELPMRHGYRRVRGDVSGFLADLDDPAADTDIGAPRAALLAALRSYFARRTIDANWDAIGKLPDEALMTTLCMVCPFEPAEKQALLEAATPADRGATLLALLEMAAAGDGGAGGGRAVS